MIVSRLGVGLSTTLLANVFSNGSLYEIADLADVVAVKSGIIHNEERYHGTVTVREALEQSMNSASVRIGLATGVQSVIRTAHTLGVQTDISDNPAMLLGAVDIPPIEMADAYSTIARIGSRLPLRTIRFVTDDRGRYGFVGRAERREGRGYVAQRVVPHARRRAREGRREEAGARFRLLRTRRDHGPHEGLRLRIGLDPAARGAGEPVAAGPVALEEG